MPNNEYENEPNQSRSEDIISSILDGTEYDEPARSRIEYLLIELKNAIEGGGGGGGVTSYSPLTEKPKIDNHTLQSGNNTSSDLGLQTKIDADHKLSADVIDDTNSTNKFNVKSDWNAASGAAGEILNKPTLGTASAKNVPASGDAATGEVVLGSDTRLTDARNAKDVYNWAKQENKPSYGYSEIQNTPTIPDKLSDLTDDTTHRTVTDTEKNTWNGKQNALTFDNAPTSNSDNPVKSGGVYTALSGKQNNLSEAQMAAANSGIDSTKVAQIETNKNNILSSLDANGAKNLLDYTLESLKAINSRGTWANNVYTVNNAKYTVNSDMSITAETIGTPSGSTLLALKSNVANSYVGSILSGCPTGGNNATYNIAVEQSASPYTLLAQDTGLSATIPNNTSGNIIIYVVVKTTLSEPIVFKPMICSADLWTISHQYQPYAMSNVELTNELTNDYTSNLSSTYIDVQNSSFVISKIGKMCIAKFDLTTNYSALTGNDIISSSTKIPSAYLPKSTTYTSAVSRDAGSWASANFNAVALAVATDGTVYLRTGAGASSSKYIVGEIMWFVS